MSSSASVGEIPWGKVVGVIVVVAVVVYIIYKLNEISQGVQTVADNQNRTKGNPEPIDVVPEPIAEPMASAPQAESAIVPEEAPITRVETPAIPDFRYSEDFQTVYSNGKEYHLTLNQGRVIERLWVAKQNKTPEIHQSTLLEQLEIYSRRLRDVFKNSPALGTLVVKGERKGHFRLNLF